MNRRVVSGAAARALALSLLVSAVACKSDTDTPSEVLTPAAVRPSVTMPATAPAGAPAPVLPSVVVETSTGEPVSGVTVVFAVAEGGGTVTGATPLTNASGVATVGGWTLGTVAGTNSLTATVADIPPVTFTAMGVAGPAAKLAISVQPVGAGTGQPLATQPAVVVQDQFGNTLTTDTGRTVTAAIAAGGDGTLSGTPTASTAAGIATFSNLTIAGATNATRALVFTAAGLTSATSSAISLSPVSAGPTITAITPAVLTPGATATITGTSFGSTPEANAVTVDGVSAIVTAASATQLTVTVPVSGLACKPVRDVAVVVAAGGASATRQHSLRTATPRALGVGQSLILASAADVPCNELPSGGQYVVSVFNTSTNGAASTGFRLQGGPQGFVAADVVELAPSRRQPISRTDLPHGRLFEPSREEFDRRVEHFAHLERNRAEYRELAARKRAFESRGRGAAVPNDAVTPSRSTTASSLQPYAPIPTTLGAQSTLQFRYLGAAETRAVTTVYVGTRVIIVEDVASPLAGTLATFYQEIGADFDSRMYDILRANFGDPLASDARLHSTGRVVLFFTPRVTEQSVAGFVSACDMFTTAECAASNEQAVEYLSTPLPNWTAANVTFWKSYMHAVIQHESKHVVSHAERTARGAASFEESWLEEGSAEIALEMYSRNFCGFGAGVRVTYAQVQSCMTTKPWTPDLVEGIGFQLYNFYRSVETLSPIVGNVVVNGVLQPFNYESAWSLLRWTAGTYGGSDAAFFKGLVQETALTGVPNLLAHSGQPLTTLLGEWSLMLDVDDRPGFTPASSHLTFPTIRTRDFLAGVRTAYQLTTPAFPLPVRSAPAGSSFSTDVPGIAAGTTSIFELGGVGATTQIIELRDTGGGVLPSGSPLRLSLVRLQ